MPARASAAPLPGWRSEREVSDQLQRLGVRAAGIENDLADLQRSLTYQLLFDGERVSGVTLARLEPVARAVDELWLGFGVLNEVLAEAAQVVGNGVRPDLDDLRMMEWQLFEESLELGGRHLTPEALLDELVQALSATAQVVEEVNDVWRHTVPGLARCAEEVEPLLRQAHGIGAAVPAEHLRQLQAQVSWLRGQAPRDPIGVAEAFQRDVLPRFELARGQLRDGLRQQREVLGEMDRAHAEVLEVGPHVALAAPDLVRRRRCPRRHGRPAGVRHRAGRPAGAAVRPAIHHHQRRVGTRSIDNAAKVATSSQLPDPRHSRVVARSREP